VARLHPDLLAEVLPKPSIAVAGGRMGKRKGGKGVRQRKEGRAGGGGKKMESCAPSKVGAYGSHVL